MLGRRSAGATSHSSPTPLARVFLVFTNGIIQEQTVTGMVLRRTLGVALLTGAWFLLDHLSRTDRAERVLSDQVLVLRALSAP
jgi:hypothetical protein